MTSKRYHVESLARGLSVLSLFDAESRWLSMSDIARATGLSVATVLRLVRTLEQQGFLRQSEVGKQYARANNPNGSPPRTSGGLSALDVLDSFTEERAEWSVADLARRHRVADAAMTSILEELANHKYVEFDAASSRYRVGPRPVALSYAGLTRSPVRVHALPVLADLVGATGLDATLAVPLGDTAVYAARLNGPDVWIGHNATGRTVPLHATAVGKLLLASLSDDEIDATLDRTGLPRFSETTIVDRGALALEVARARQTNLALDRGEWMPDRGCVAAAVRHADGQVIAAIGASGPVARIVAEQDVLAVQVGQAANRISYALGYLRAYY